MKYVFSCQVTRLPYCCGVYEVGGFHTRQTSKEQIKEYPGEYKSFKYDSAKDAAAARLKELIEGYPNFALQFWFYKASDYKGSYEDIEYTENDFREAVKAHPNCKELAEYVNKNSGNMINGFIIDNSTSKEKSAVFASSEDDDD